MNHMPPELETMFQKIGELPENWNSYGAAPISKWSIDQAKAIVNEGIALGLPVPDVIPASGASVCIEWHTGAAELIIEASPWDGVTYLAVERDTQSETEGVMNDSNRSQILQRAVGPTTPAPLDCETLTTSSSRP